MTTEINIFELASRQNLEFPTVRGNVTVNQLWGIPLTAKNGFSLDDIYRTAKRELDALTEDSLVQTSRNPVKAVLELQIAIIKHIAGVRQEEAAAAVSAAEKKQRLEKLTDALSRKQDAALEDMSEEELRKQIADLKS
jgi:hypothetical protein